MSARLEVLLARADTATGALESTVFRVEVRGGLIARGEDAGALERDPGDDRTRVRRRGGAPAHRHRLAALFVDRSEQDEVDLPVEKACRPDLGGFHSQTGSGGPSIKPSRSSSRTIGKSTGVLPSIWAFVSLTCRPCRITPSYRRCLSPRRGTERRRRVSFTSTAPFRRPLRSARATPSPPPINTPGTRR